jgi:hypothetical protein
MFSVEAAKTGVRQDAAQGEARRRSAERNEKYIKIYGADERNRTANPRITSAVRYQLRHVGIERLLGNYVRSCEAFDAAADQRQYPRA